MKKTMLGLGMIYAAEPDWVKEKIDEISPSITGVQIGENYREREKNGITLRNIIKVVRYLREKSIEMVPLEKEELLKENWPLEYAKYVLEGRFSKEKVKRDLVHKELLLERYEGAGRGFMDPHGAYQDIYYSQIFRGALEILDRVTTLDELMVLWNQSNEKLQAGMLEKIQEVKPDLVVMGWGHANRIKDSLPDYEYVRSPFSKKEVD